MPTTFDDEPDRWKDDEYDADYADFADTADEVEELPCPSCGRFIAEDSPKCPHCGDWVIRRGPAAARGRNLLYLALIMLVIAGLIGITSC